MPGKQLKTYTKELRIKAVSGAECTPDMLAKINAYALTPLKAEDVYVRKFLMSHNCIDRDNECFPPDMLDQFAATIPGKACIPSHDRKSLPLATWFDSATETMTPDQFQALTGETAKLPQGVDQVKVQWAWMYTLVKDWNQQLRDSIDGGIIRSCSIGFAAADLNAVKDSPTGTTQYWEYCCPGEALEGSLVWLGAQPGATAQKHVKDNHPTEDHYMKNLVVLLGIKTLTADSTPEQVAAAVKSAMDGKDATIKALEPRAADGDAYRADLVAECIKFAALTGDVKDDEKAKEEESAFLKTLPIARLKIQRDKYETQAREKFPTHTLFTGKDETDKGAKEKAAAEKAGETSGRKDFTSVKHNELFKTLG